ncbi:MAG TPA: LacI family DNA-binding transcriptional regulator [Devosia sp.]
MATIYDVAKAAKVSPKTVSRVLNGDAPVGKETRDAVNAAIAALGYVPSNAARMMRSNKSGLIGVITGAISVTSEPEQPAGLPELLLVRGIQHIIGPSGKTLMIADTGGSRERVPDLIKTFLEHRVEGLIYVAEYHQKVSLPPVTDDTPLVLTNCFDDAGTPAVVPDDRRGQHDLVARLIAAGHERIAYLTLREEIVATSLRKAGYRDALAEAGIPYDPALVQRGELDSPEGETQVLWAAIDRILRLPNPPTVFCCGNDRQALKVYGILRSRGMRLPEDISVAGYDNYRLIAETLLPPLTTVELPYTAMGVRAAERLLELISGEGREDAGPDIVAGPVHWRGSVTERRSPNVSQLKLVRED